MNKKSIQELANLTKLILGWKEGDPPYTVADVDLILSHLDDIIAYIHGVGHWRFFKARLDIDRNHIDKNCRRMACDFEKNNAKI